VTATRLQRPAALLYGLRPAPPFGRCEHLGALPQTPRSPRGRGAGGRAASLCSTCPLAWALVVPSASRPCPFGVAARALTLPPLGTEQGSRGWCGPQPRSGEDSAPWRLWS